MRHFAGVHLESDETLRAKVKEAEVLKINSNVY